MPHLNSTDALALYVLVKGGVLHAIGAFLQHFATYITEALKPFGAWGLAALSVLDSALLPIPWQGMLIFYVHGDPAHYLIYPLISAAASTLGSLVPFYLGRLGGEIFLLGKINRERYESLRDRFERQEFLAIAIPAMGPPPTPFKLFEFCAGVFEMRLHIFLLATFLGKLVQFTVMAVLIHIYGPGALSAAGNAARQHPRLLFTVLGLFVVALAIWVARKVFAKNKATTLPIEEQTSKGEHVIVEE